MGPHLIIAVGPEGIRIMQERIENTVSVNWVTHTTHPDGATEGNHEHNNEGDDWLNE